MMMIHEDRSSDVGKIMTDFASYHKIRSQPCFHPFEAPVYGPLRENPRSRTIEHRNFRDGAFGYFCWLELLWNLVGVLASRGVFTTHVCVRRTQKKTQHVQSAEDLKEHPPMYHKQILGKIQI
jgi:hypothetical protein